MKHLSILRKCEYNEYLINWKPIILYNIETIFALFVWTCHPWLLLRATDQLPKPLISTSFDVLPFDWLLSCPLPVSVVVIALGYTLRSHVYIMDPVYTLPKDALVTQTLYWCFRIRRTDEYPCPNDIKTSQVHVRFMDI